MMPKGNSENYFSMVEGLPGVGEKASKVWKLSFLDKLYELQWSTPVRVWGMHYTSPRDTQEDSHPNQLIMMVTNGSLLLLQNTSEKEYDPQEPLAAKLEVVLDLPMQCFQKLTLPFVTRMLPDGSEVALHCFDLVVHIHSLGALKMGCESLESSFLWLRLDSGELRGTALENICHQYQSCTDSPLEVDRMDVKELVESLQISNFDMEDFEVQSPSTQISSEGFLELISPMRLVRFFSDQMNTQSHTAESPRPVQLSLKGSKPFLFEEEEPPFIKAPSGLNSILDSPTPSSFQGEPTESITIPSSPSQTPPPKKPDLDFPMSPIKPRSSSKRNHLERRALNKEMDHSWLSEMSVPESKNLGTFSRKPSWRPKMRRRKQMEDLDVDWSWSPMIPVPKSQQRTSPTTDRSPSKLNSPLRNKLRIPWRGSPLGPRSTDKKELARRKPSVPPRAGTAVDYTSKQSASAWLNSHAHLEEELDRPVPIPDVRRSSDSLVMKTNVHSPIMAPGKKTYLHDIERSPMDKIGSNLIGNALSLDEIKSSNTKDQGNSIFEAMDKESAQAIDSELALKVSEIFDADGKEMQKYGRLGGRHSSEMKLEGGWLKWKKKKAGQWSKGVWAYEIEKVDIDGKNDKRFSFATNERTYYFEAFSAESRLKLVHGLSLLIDHVQSNDNGDIYYYDLMK